MLKHRYEFEALGAPWRIETEEEIGPSLRSVIQNRIGEFDVTYSRFRNDSLVTRIANEAGEYTFPKDAKKLFDFYESLYKLTDGKMTPLIGDMIARAGYDADYSFEAQPQKPIASWDKAMRWSKLTLKTTQPIILDVGAAGKGYLVDIIAALLDERSINEYVIDASGDLRHKGTSENTVGLEHPIDFEKVIGAVSVQNKSLCASAHNRRVWGEGMHHIFDPDEMAPTSNIIATWVIAAEAMMADGLSTALFFVEPKVLSDMYDFEYVRMYSNGSIAYSPTLEENIF